MRIDRRRFLKSATAAAVTPLIAGCGPDLVPVANVPRSNFDEDSTAEEVTAGMDLSGKIAVVTGCNSGIGFETMRVLALRGCYVIGTGRTLEKAEAACAKVKGITTPIQLELSDYESIVNCAEEIRKMNSGAERETVYGLEKHFVVNHLGHFILVNRLLDRLFFSWQGRVVVVASRAAYRSAPQEGIQFGDLRAVGDYSASRAYAHSKLANVLFSYELARLLKGTRITSNSLHPGVIDTNIARNVAPILRTGFSLLTRIGGKTVEQGAATSCYVATNPSLGAVSGEYFEDCNAVTVQGDNHMHDREQASRLWVVSEQLTKDYLVEHQRPDWSEFENGLRRPGPN
jgi:NAD(P)-dependent dehydrogenase (short-subunit alcohol dehydrogenase family)